MHGKDNTMRGKVADVFTIAGELIKDVGWSETDYIQHESVQQQKERVGPGWIHEGLNVCAYSLPASITFAAENIGIEDNIARAIAHTVAYTKFGDQISISVNFNMKDGNFSLFGVSDIRRFPDSHSFEGWIDSLTYPLEDFERILSSGVTEELVRANQICEDKHDALEILSVAREKALVTSYDANLKWYTYLHMQ